MMGVENVQVFAARLSPALGDESLNVSARAVELASWYT
jgi:hypothetical protein